MVGVQLNKEESNEQEANYHVVMVLIFLVVT
jgi:hypothetical protein